MACRSQTKGQTAVEKVKAATGYAKAELWIIDLADFDSVRQFADEFERKADGWISSWRMPPSEHSENGWELKLVQFLLSLSQTDPSPACKSTTSPPRCCLSSSFRA
ncbi:hypothetical protein DFH07DRAFT_794372 [Mycena maculata]|uniref:Uncharacterized protein n=1 Tax=Mycena maculata TaxID=230809 RepID=A0AAD7NYC0_9AGAR|nr:hypothetical protein DFH07DRAFT_794372 [Mycena maculata]